MTQYGQDLFSRSNTANGTWGVATDGETWARPFGSATTYSVTSNRGVIGNTPGTWDHFVLGSNTISTTMDVLVHITPDATGENFGVLLRVSSVGTTSYKVMYEGDLSTKGLYLYYDSPGTGLVQLGSVSAFSLTIGHGYWVRGQINGSNLMGKLWDDSGGEPGAWGLTSSVGTHTITSGGFGILGAANTNLKFDSFTATDGSTVVNQPDTYTNTIASIESLTSRQAVLSSGVTASIEAPVIRQAATMSNSTVILENVSAGTFQRSTYTNVIASTESFSVAQRAIQIDLTASIESLLAAQRITLANTTALIEQNVGVSQPAVPNTDPAAPMVYSVAQLEYARLKGTTTFSHVLWMGLVYYPSATVVSENVVPSEIDILLIGETITSLHILRTINDVTAFIAANP